MDRRTFLGLVPALAAMPLVPAAPTWRANGAMVGYADLSEFVIDGTKLAECASQTGYIWGVKRTGELVFSVNFPPSEDYVSRGAGSTAGPAAFWR